MLLGWFGLDLGLEWLSLVRRGWLLVALGGGGESGAAPPAERDTATGATRGGVDEVRAGGRCVLAAGVRPVRECVVAPQHQPPRPSGCSWIR